MRNIDLNAEREYENKKARGENPRSSQSKYYWAIALAVENHNRITLDSIAEKSVLEIGCASGYDAVSYSKYATKYVGVDISDAAIKNANELKLTNAEFICVDGHNIPKDDGSFDCVIVNSLLHHLDLEVTFREIHRLLRKDGVLIFREPLGTNPLFQFYRKLTPTARTVDERPFTFSDLRLMNEYFLLERVQWFGFLNIMSAFIKLDFVRLALTKIDNLISLTPIKYFFWQFSGVARKKEG